MIKFLYPLYNFASYLVWPFAHLYLRYRIRKGKEIEGRLSERFGVSTEIRPEGKLVWFHVASLGEGLSALPLIKKIARKKNHHVLVTYGTVTASEILPNRFPKNTLHCFVPFDLPIWVTRFLDHFRPDVGVIIESEIWPALLLESKKAAIPLVLINGRMSARSFTRWQYAKPIVRELLSAFSVGLMQDDAMAKRYQALGLSNAEVLGNIKLASDPLPANPDLLKKLRTTIGDRPCWVAASMHVYEEDFVLAAHEKLRVLYPDLLTVLVPRKLEHVASLYRKLRSKGLSFISHDRGADLVDEEIYVVDVMGEMGTFLTLSEITYVGGSQYKTTGKPLGGHNPLEPALLGNAICFGPEMSNTQKVADELIEAGAAEIVETPEMLVELVDDLLKNPELRADRAKRALNYAESQKTLVDKALSYVLNVETRHCEETTRIRSNKDTGLPRRKVLLAMTRSRPAFWSSDSIISKILWLPSKVYEQLSSLYQGTKTIRKLDIPVICVGNIIAGGAGKTPTIMRVAEYLSEKGRTPHIVSRGYGRKRTDTLRVDETRTVADAGDEPLLLSRVAPTWVGDRYDACLKAQHAGATHILLDDGFQDVSIHKDFSFLVFDGHYGIGNGKLIPAGPLRESLDDGLDRADVTLIIGEDRTGLGVQLSNFAELLHINGKFIAETKLPKKKFVAFAGIGNPDKFFESLADIGAEIVHKMPLPDHTYYSDKLVKELEDKALALDAELVTTEKDAVKFPAISLPLHVLKIKLEVSDLSCLDHLAEEKSSA